MAACALVLDACSGLPPRATAQRSSFATDSVTTRAGTVELELGGGLGPRSDRDLVTAVKYGLDDFTEVYVCGSPYLRARVSGETLRGRSATDLGWRHRFYESEDMAAGVQAIARIAHGSEHEGLAGRENDYFLAGILDSYGEHIGITAFYQLGSLGASGEQRDTQHALSVIAGAALSEQLDAFTEVFGEFTHARSANPVAAQLGVAWNRSANVIWDLALQRGLNDDGGHTRVFFGVTWNLGALSDG
ncbi:MAG: hypothetical protein DHS20C15_33090 [Planctomycetota bacterium]|nr:MAG: hypothetical protein DHS20C15_33090 [Planctomycetota bacterium]